MISEKSEKSEKPEKPELSEKPEKPEIAEKPTGDINIEVAPVNKKGPLVEDMDAYDMDEDADWGDAAYAGKGKRMRGGVKGTDVLITAANIMRDA